MAAAPSNFAPRAGLPDMVCFHTKNPDLGIFWTAFVWNILVGFVTGNFGMFCRSLVGIMLVYFGGPWYGLCWYILEGLGMGYVGIFWRALVWRMLVYIFYGHLLFL
jgi:hypothetical protein